LHTANPTFLSTIAHLSTLLNGPTNKRAVASSSFSLGHGTNWELPIFFLSKKFMSKKMKIDSAGSPINGRFTKTYSVAKVNNYRDDRSEFVKITLSCKNQDDTVSTIERMPSVNTKLEQDWTRIYDEDQNLDIFRAVVEINQKYKDACISYLEDEGFVLS
jgi:hypothetical protein